MLSLSDVPFPPPERWTAGLLEGRRGVLVHDKGGRRVWRVQDGDLTFFAKCGLGGKAREIAREAETHDRMRRCALPVARVLAAGRADGASWLVTAAAEGRTLASALDHAIASRDASQVRRLVDRAARTLARVHAAGVRWPDATSAHVFVGVDSAADDRVTLIDVARAEFPRRGVSETDRVDDAAALLFSLPLGIPRPVQVRLLREILGARGRALRGALPLVRRSLRRLALRTRWRHRHAHALPEVVEALAALRGESPDAVRGALFDALFSTVGVDVVRSLPDRENRRFTGASGRAYFVKVYPPVRDGYSPAMSERRAAHVLTSAGVATCRVVAYAEDLERGSLVVVRGCDGAPLDDLLRTGVAYGARRVLAGAVGRLYGRMRRAGLRHRDAYPCHVFAAARPGGRGVAFDLRLIDLTRAGRAPLPRGRWHVKDVAQLWHGLPRPPVTATDAVRFLRAYLDVPRLDAPAKRFARRVIRKERRIRARQDRRARAEP